MSTEKNKKQLNSAQVSYLKIYNLLSAVGWLNLSFYLIDSLIFNIYCYFLFA